MTLFDDIQTPSPGCAPVRPGDGPNTGPAAGDTPMGGSDGAGPVLTIHVVGLPAPQGSKRAFVTTHGRAVVVDDNKKHLRTWRDDVKTAALDALHHWWLTMQNPSRPDDPTRQWQPLTNVELDVTFLLPRPRGHYGTGRNAHQLRAGAPKRPTVKPDLDKLLRSTLDALKVAGVYTDDSVVTTLTGRKHYATHHPGAVITIYGGRT